MKHVLGNNHVFHPSFNRATCQRRVANRCEGYVQDLQESTQLQCKIDPTKRDNIEAHAVFPVQWTQPLLSSIHTTVSAPLVDTTHWAIELGPHP